jgi:hypothetical protein
MTLDLASTLGLFSVFCQRFSTETFVVSAFQVAIILVVVPVGRGAAGITKL